MLSDHGRGAQAHRKPEIEIEGRLGNRQRREAFGEVVLGVLVVGMLLQSLWI